MIRRLVIIDLYSQYEVKILTKNKKILIVTECFYPEEFKINDIAFAWKSKGYEVDVLTLVPITL